MNLRADSVTGSTAGFQPAGGGSIPTSALHLELVGMPIAKDFLAKYHYLGAKPFRCSAAFGCFSTELLGVAVFHGISAPETAVGAFGLDRKNQNGLWELGRLALRPDTNGGNVGSYLIRRAIKLLAKEREVRAVISYAEAPRHTGAIYRACGFAYCGLSSKKSDFYVGGKIQERGKTKGIVGEWRPRPQKHRFVLVFDKALALKWVKQ